MGDSDKIEEVQERADLAYGKLSNDFGPKDLAEAKGLIEKLRNIRDYERMGRLAEAVCRHDPKDPTVRRLYAQYLIDTGHVTVAVDVLTNLVRRLKKSHPEAIEARGLLGRANKQIFFDASDKSTDGARKALKKAIDSYRKPFEADHNNTWHGVNLLALVDRTKRLGLRMASDLTTRDVAEAVVGALERTPRKKRDEWFLPTLAEALLGLGDWDAVEAKIKEYASKKDVPAFLIRSTLRQFEEVWDLSNRGDQDDRTRGQMILDMLRARLARLQGGEQDFSIQQLQSMRARPEPDSAHLEAVLGDRGTMDYRWWKQGLDCAASVAAIRRGSFTNYGTGFVVRAKDLGLSPADELLVLTNFHVVNARGANRAITPDETRIAFEAIDGDRSYEVDEIIWSSEVDRHDATLLRPAQPLQGVEPLDLAKRLPTIGNDTLVYVIGHPRGDSLSFSFQDNQLIDHEGKPDGRPHIPGVERVHYKAPTEKGSSGSPVFNQNSWQVIALHHAGAKDDMPKLNGKDGNYSANEGISIQSIKKTIGEEIGHG